MLKRPLRALHRVLSHPRVELVAGLLIAGVAVYLLFGLAGDESPIEHEGECGMLVLGVFLIVRSAALLLEGVTLLAAGVHGAVAICRNAVVRGLTWLANHPLFGLITALAVTAAGFIEAWEVRDRGVYGEVGYLGLLLLGLSMLAKSAFGILNAVLILKERHGGVWLAGKRLRALTELVQKPAFEVLIGLAIIATGVWEEVFVEVSEAFRGPDANDVIILLGLAQVVKFLPHLFVSAEVLADAAE